MPVEEKIKPIMLYPPPELRRRIEAEANKQNRSLNNLLIVVLTRVFRDKSEDGHGS